jgi:hypothetical protein
MTDQTPTTTPARPWWAAALTSVIATILGSALAVVSVCLLRPALAPDGDLYWGGLFGIGLGLATTGASLLGSGARGGGTDQRGSIDVQALGAAAGVAFALALVLMALLSHGCGGSQYAAQRKADIDWTPGPPCHIGIRLDGEDKPSVTIDAPEACEPPPTECPEVRP